MAQPLRQESGYVENLVAVFLFIINAKNDALGSNIMPIMFHELTKQYNMEKKNYQRTCRLYNTYAKIATFRCHLPLHYGLTSEHRYVLYLETQVYLRDLRCWLPGMTLKYGNTHTIIVIDKNHD